MNLLKYLLPICFFPVVIAFCYQTDNTNIFEKTDTMKVHSTGINNKIVIDSINMKDSLNELVLPLMKGEINQAGQNNIVDINTRNKHQNNKDRTASNKKSSTIKITQTGKNNSVKINSR